MTDYINKKQAAKIWKVKDKTVEKYCEEDMVPFAERDGKDWKIPAGAEKPRFTRHAVVQLLYFLIVFAEGATPNLLRTGLSWDDVNSAYPYLADLGYITRPGYGKTMVEQLKNVTITSKGLDLIHAENEERKKNGKTEISGRLKLSLKLAEAELEVKKQF